MRPNRILLQTAFLAGSFLSLAGAATAMNGEPSAVSDVGGDITYSSMYLGARNHNYLDVLTASIESAENGSLNVILKTADATLLSHLPENWVVSCQLNLGLTREGRAAGTLASQWIKAQWLGQEPIHSVTFTGPSSGARPIDIKHGFSLDARRPAYATYQIASDDLLSHADAVNKVEATCNETYFQDPRTPTSQVNFDAASGATSFAIPVHSSSEAPRIPVDAPSGGASPWPGFPAAVAACLLVLYGRRR